MLILWADMEKDFVEGVCQVVAAIPRGKVLTYGRVASLAGKPSYARQVARAMRAEYEGRLLPCHRVVNSVGRCAPGWVEQPLLLRKEGITFKSNGNVDLEKHLWRFIEFE